MERAKDVKKEDAKLKEFKEKYEKPQITTYSEEDILGKYEVCGFTF